jgi:hypothetical protein
MSDDILLAASSGPQASAGQFRDATFFDGWGAILAQAPPVRSPATAGAGSQLSLRCTLLCQLQNTGGLGEGRLMGS